MTDAHPHALPPLKGCPFCDKPLTITGGVNPSARCDTEECWMSERRMSVVVDEPRQVAQWNTRPERDLTAPVSVGDVEEHARQWRGQVYYAIEKLGEPTIRALQSAVEDRLTIALASTATKLAEVMESMAYRGSLLCRETARADAAESRLADAAGALGQWLAAFDPAAFVEHDLPDSKYANAARATYSLKGTPDAE